MGCRASKNVCRVPPTFAESESPATYYSQYSSESKQHWTSDKTACVDIRFAQQGVASAEGTEPKTLVQLVQQAVQNKASEPFLRVETVPKVIARGETPPPCEPRDQWKTWTLQQYFDECKLVGQGFMALGLERFDAVTIYGFNAPEWIMAEMGCIFAGGIAAGIYPTDTPEQVQFKALHSGAVVACVQNNEKMESLLSVADALPKLKAIVVWSPEGPLGSEERQTSNGQTVRCMTWDALKTLGDSYVGAETIESRMEAQRPGECCSYIYTSGTTGQPKAVMISHDNIVYEAMGATRLINGFGKTGEERVISYLPLSHVAGMMVDIVCPIVAAAELDYHCTVYFARPYDLKAGTIGDRLRGVNPTIFLGVPRVWEKIQEKMVATAARAGLSGLKLKLVKWAKGVGLEHQKNCQLGGSGAYSWGYGFAESKVLNVVKQKLGLQECKFCFTGAAPIKTETLEYFGSLGIQINEVYGMSECTGATTWSTDLAHEWGSCGWAMPGAEVSIRYPEASGQQGEVKRGEDGEICYRGRHIMMGYMANPDLGDQHMETIAGKNRGAIDSQGWLRSGDKGRIDDRGMVRITGRYKELIIGAGGENIAPVPVEDGIKARCPAISNIMMVGDKRKYNVALVTLKAVGATGEAPGTDQLEAVSQAIAGVDTISAAMDPEGAMQQAIHDAIAATNSDGTCCPMNASKVRKFTILPRDFSVQTGELTPTLKLKRSVVVSKNAAAIDSLYAPEVMANNNMYYVPFSASGETKQ